MGIAIRRAARKLLIALVALSTAVQPALAGYLYRVPLDGGLGGVAYGNLSASPSNLAFGQLPVTGTAQQDVTLVNTGSAPVAIDSVTMAGNGFLSTHTCGSQLNPGGTCRATVTFNPQSQVAYSGALQISVDNAQSSISIPVTGTGAVGGLTATPSSVVFGGTTQVGSTAPYIDVEIKNVSPLAVHNISFGMLEGAGNFSQNNTCGTPTLYPGQSCTLRVGFKPLTAGALEGSVAITSDAAAGTLIVPVQGVSQAPSSDLTVSSFATTQVGQSASGTVTLRNTGAASVLVGEASTGTADFVVDPQACAGSLSAGNSCVYPVTFTPSAAGVRTATFSVNVAGQTKSAGLSAQASAVELALSAPAFVGTAVGDNSVATATLTNSGIGAVTLTKPNSSSVVGADFSFVSTTCAGTLAPASSCDIDVRFSPTVSGPRTATLSVATDAGVRTASLTASGLQVALQVSTSSLSYGEHLVGTSSNVQAVTVTNAGDLAAQGLSVTSSAPFSLEDSTCASALGIGKSCTFGVRFTPVSSGSVERDITVSATNAPHAVTVTATGTGVLGTASVSPSQAVFSPQQTGTTSAPLTLTVTNTGDGPLTISGVSISNGDTDFGQNNGCRGTLSKGASCLVDVSFTPSLGGVRTGVLSLTHNGVGGVTNVSLSGSGELPAASLSNIDFGNVAVGESSQQTATLTNLGVGSISVTAPVAASVTGTDFRYVATNCPAALPSGVSCQVTVEFKPTAMTTRTGGLSLSTGAGGKSSGLSGTGQKPVLTFNPASLAFNAVQPGSTADSVMVTLTNSGTQAAAPLTLTAPTGYVLTANACGTSLAAGASCTFKVRFAPTQAQPYGGSVTVQPTGDLLPLTGTGQAPSATLSSIDFGTANVGSAPVMTATLQNTGVGPLSVATLTSAAVSGTDFSYLSSTCPASLAPAETCAVSVTFSPSDHVLRSGQLSVTTGAGALSALLTGTGQRAYLSMNPSSVAFGAAQVGAVRTSSTITLNNTGNLDASGVAITPPTGYALASNGCSSTLGAKSSCTFTVRFAPTAAQPYDASLTVTASGVAQSTLPMTASGQAASATLSGVSFGTLQVGNSSTMTATLTNTGIDPIAVTVPTASSVTGTDFSYVTTTCSTSLSNVAGNNTCTVSVKFTPTAAASRTGNVTVVTEAGTKSAALSSQGSQGAVTFTPTTGLAFGTVQKDKSSTVQSIVVKNTGTAPLTISGVTVSAGAAHYGQSNSCGNPVAVNATCTVSVMFTPTATGSLPGEITLAHNGAGSATVVPLTGTGQLAQATLTIAGHGNVPVNSAVDVTAVLKNTGLSDMTVSLSQTPVTTAPSGASNAEFTFVDTTCTASLAPQDTCNIVVRFSPTVAAARTGTLTVATEAGSKTAALSGTGVASSLVFIPSTIAGFGNRQINSSIDSEQIALKNTGTLAATSLVVDVPTPYSLVSNTCTTSLAAGATCTLYVRYTPTSAGYTSLKLTASGAGSSAVLPVSGTGVDSSLTFLAPGADFFAVVGSFNDFNVTLTNSGGSSVTLGAVSVAGNTAEFSVAPTGSTCGAAIAPGTTCVVKGRFTPSARGIRPPATYTISTGAGAFSAVMSTGNGTRTNLVFGTTSVSFGSQPVGSETKSATITLTNNSGNSATGTWTIPPGYSLVENGCPASGTNHTANLSCSFKIQFIPAAAQPYDGTLVLQGSGQSASIQLTAAGTAITGVQLTGGDFGTSVDLSTSKTRKFTLTNATSAATTLASPTITSATTDFAMDAAGTTCGTSIAASSSCFYSVRFTPTAQGSRTGQLNVVTGVGTRSIALNGSGGVANITVTASKSLAFGTRQVGEPGNSSPTILTFKNTGDSTENLALVLPSGFSWYQNQCTSGLLLSGASCTAGVAPYATVAQTQTNGGLVTGSVYAEAGGVTSAMQAVSFTAVLPTVTFTSGAAGSVSVGSAKNFTVTMTNAGINRILLDAHTLTGNTTEFTSAPGSTCGSQLAVNASCVFNLTFVPAAAGVRTPAQLRININSNGSPFVYGTVSLTGTGS